MSISNDIVVFISSRNSTCGECKPAGNTVAAWAGVPPPRHWTKRLAVTAHVRHTETNYDELLLKSIERWDTREKVYPEVSRILDRWKHGGSKH